MPSSARSKLSRIELQPSESRWQDSEPLGCFRSQKGGLFAATGAAALASGGGHLFAASVKRHQLFQSADRQ